MKWKILDRLSFAQKIWSGTLVFCVLLAVVAILMLNSQKKVTESVHGLISKDMEMLSSATRLNSGVKAYSASIGLYLLSNNEQYREQMTRDAESISSDVTRLKALAALGNDDSTIAQQLDELKATFEQFRETGNSILKVASDPMLRIPGLAMARETLAPLSVAATTALKNMQQTMLAEGIDTDNLSLLNTTNDMLYNLARLSASIRAYLSFRDEGQAGNVRTFVSQLRETADKLLQDGDLELDQEDAITQVQENLGQYNKSFDALVAFHGSNKWRQDSYRVDTELTPLEGRLSREIDSLTQEIHRHTNKATHDLESSLDFQGSFTLALIGSGMLTGLLVMWIIIRLVKSRLHDSVDALKAVADSGNLAQQLDEHGRDEASDLARYFNRFVAKIKSLVDLVIASSASLAAESQRMNEATSRSQHQVAQQQHDIGEIATSIEHVASSAEQVKVNADAAADAAASANDHAQHGQAVVGEVTGAIQELANEVAEAAQVIARVETGSEQIGMVLSVIRSISEQTNLLALNAAIEAARAGEHGRGFAVVADEVRSLSEKIHNETDQIQEIINQLQDSSREAASVMNRGTERSSAVAEKAETAGSALSEIASSVATISDMNGNIAEFSGNQLERVEEVRDKVASIRGIAEEAASTAAQAAASSSEFTIMAGQLQDLVKQFLQEQNDPSPTTRAVADSGSMPTDTPDRLELF